MNDVPSLSKSGFSLMEMVVAMGVLSVIILGSFSLIDSQSGFQKYYEDKMEINSQIQIVSRALNTSQGCFNTLNSSGSVLTLNPLDNLPTSIQNEDGAVLLREGQLLRGSRNILLTNLTIGNTIPDGSSGIIEIGLTFDRTNGGQRQRLKGRQNIFVSVPVHVKTGVGGLITECIGRDRSLASKTCEQFLGGTYNTNGTTDPSDDQCQNMVITDVDEIILN